MDPNDERKYWESIPPEKRVEMIWELVVASMPEGFDPKDLRLDKTVGRIERRAR